MICTTFSHNWHVLRARAHTCTHTHRQMCFSDIYSLELVFPRQPWPILQQEGHNLSWDRLWWLLCISGPRVLFCANNLLHVPVMNCLAFFSIESCTARTLGCKQQKSILKRTHRSHWIQVFRHCPRGQPFFPVPWSCLSLWSLLQQWGGCWWPGVWVTQGTETCSIPKTPVRGPEWPRWRVWLRSPGHHELTPVFQGSSWRRPCSQGRPIPRPFIYTKLFLLGVPHWSQVSSL